MGSPPIAAGPTILASDIPYQTNSSNVNAAGIATYTADIQANITLLQPDGLDIRFVPTQQFLFATPAEMMDPVHPNAVGLAELAAAFGAAITPSTPVADSVAVAAASFAANFPPLGNHGIDMLYSGDTRYSPTDAGTFAISIYDGTSTVSLTSDSGVYPVQSPIVLTATIPQPNATGLVTFIDESGPIGSAWMNQVTPGLAQLTPGLAQLTLPSLPAGVHSVTAQYLGDVTYNASTSAPISITVSGTYSTTSLAAPATRYFAATPVPLTAAVSPASATGTITFSDGASTLAQSPVVSGIATLTTATLAPGIHSLTAAYSGNATQDPSTSPSLSIEIDLNATIVTLTSSPTAAAYGTPLVLTASIEPATATGTISLLDGTQSLGQINLANGTAIFIASNLTPGTHTITALYSGDTNDLASFTSITTQISLAPSTVTLAAIPSISTFGTPITFATNVSPSAATGTITFLDGSAILAQIPLASGNASFSTASLSPGPHSITATYSGDTLRTPSTSAAVTTTIAAIPATITLAALPTVIDASSPITLSATIFPITTTGTVLFRDATLGVLGQSAIAHGAATLTLLNPAVGLYSITAVYSGDTDDSAATSVSVATQIILNPTTSTLTASPGNAAAATPITLTATISPTTAAGSVKFLDGTVLIGTAPVANGTANFITTSLAPGVHTLHATYSGDAINAASIAAPITETIALATSSTTVSLAQNLVIASAQIIVDVAVASSTTNPTGTISIRSGATILATGTLGNASNGFAYATLTFNAATLGLGTFPIAAFYSGDPDNQPSNASTSITIAAIPTTSTLTLSAPQIPVQSSITLTASVNATGSVTFLSNGAPLATANISPSGTASYTFTPPSVGTYVLTAAYTPTGLYAASSSVAQTLTVTPPLSAALNPTSINAGPGTTESATLTLTPLSGFTGPIQAACHASVAFITCAAAPPATLSTTISTPVQIKVSTTSARLSLPITRGVVTVALALLLPLFARRKPARSLLPFAILCVILFIAGCAQGGDFGEIPPGPQTITVTITAANTPVTTTLTVNVAD